MGKMNPEKQLTRRNFLRAAATAAAGSLVACLPRSTAIPTPENQSTPVPTTVPLLTEAPSSVPVVDLTAEAIKRTTLDSNLTDVSGDVLLQGIGGEISGVFGDPKITNPLTAAQIEAARALLGQRNAGTLYAVPGGKAVIQRLTGVKDGIDYSTLTDDKVPFRVTVTMLPNTFLQTDGERRILPEKTKPGEARYLKTNDQTEWNVTSTFLIEPGFLPTGAAFWWDMGSMNLRPVMWDGNGNPRLMENIPVEVRPVAVESPTPTATKEVEDKWIESGTGWLVNEKWLLGGDIILNPDNEITQRRYEDFLEGIYNLNLLGKLGGYMQSTYGISDARSFVNYAKSGKAIKGIYFPEKQLATDPSKEFNLSLHTRLDKPIYLDKIAIRVLHNDQLLQMYPPRGSLDNKALYCGGLGRFFLETVDLKKDGKNYLQLTFGSYGLDEPTDINWVLAIDGTSHQNAAAASQYINMLNVFMTRATEGQLNRYPKEIQVVTTSGAGGILNETFYKYTATVRPMFLSNK